MKDALLALLFAGVAWRCGVSLRAGILRPEYLVLINPIWFTRIINNGDSGSWRLDWLLAFAVHNYVVEWTKPLQIFYGEDGKRVLPNLLLAMGIWMAFATLRRSWKSSCGTGPVIVKRPEDASTRQARMAGYPLPPLLMPARTTHTRFFPKKHSFSYSYFYVGIPVGWQGCAGSALSADVDLLPSGRKTRGWFDVSAADYLQRTGKRKSLESKLRDYMRGEGVQDRDWSFAYLCTAPRFLGYSFNPVSFWYIYNAQSQLVMMVLEVNNTFDERRMYLLKGGEGHGEEDGATPDGNQKFKDQWPKDFHVSPFNSRKGSYSLVAKDPLSPGHALNTVIDNTITLRSNKGGTKLVARVFSERRAYDPADLTMVQLLPLLASWFWVGFMTFPRIIYEAGRLFFARKLHVWYRPEVLPSSLARHSTVMEQRLEQFFRSYLQDLVARATVPVKVIYTPPGDMGERQTYVSPSCDDKGATGRSLPVQILSPAFYTRFLHYAHSTEAFNREGLCTDEKNRTVHVSHPDLLDVLLRTREGAAQKQEKSWLADLRWKILRKARCPPPLVSYPEEPRGRTDDNAMISDIRTYGLSPLDQYVRSSCRPADASAYRRMATKVFVAQRYALGIPALPSIADCILRVIILFATYGIIARARHTHGDINLAGIDTHATSQQGLLSCSSLLAASLVHIWAFIKG